MEVDGTDIEAQAVDVSQNGNGGVGINQSVQFEDGTEFEEKVHTKKKSWKNGGTLRKKLTATQDLGKSEDDISIEEEKAPPIKTLQLFRFADRNDKLLIAVGIICALIHGAATPIFTIIFGDVIDSLGTEELPDAGLLLDQIADSSVWFVVLGIIAFVTSLFQVLGFMMSGARQAQRIRKLYIESIFRQDMAWFDSKDAGELTARVSSDVDIISRGIGDKVGSGLQFFSMFFTGFVVGFVYGWKLTLVILSVTPFIVISGAFFAKFAASGTTEGQDAYARAGGIAEEVFSLIRTVVAFGGEEREISRYQKELDSAYRVGVKRSHMQGLGMGVTFFFIFGSYALAFWYGNTLVGNGEMTPGRVITVFFSVVIGAMGIGQAAPAIQAIGEARGAAPKVFAIIASQSAIDNFSTEGEILKDDEVEGNIEFRNVQFAYPTRSEDLVLHNLQLSVKKGQTLALVGPSGCGKSTTIQLVERFYDPIQGDVLLDGKSLPGLNIQSLRSQIGLVSQMPTLFAATIKENIELGAGFDMIVDAETGERKFERRQVTFEQVQNAAKEANAHDFIMKLPEGYDTMLGQRGALLSGGQKQRIAIARALVRNPKVLLLDEATSALDSRSERIVQGALETAAKGRTTIVIAHRLSTIRNADMIAVFQKGAVIECGNHEALMAIESGHYRAMVELQNLHQAENKIVETAEEDVDPDEIDAHLAEEYNKNVAGKTTSDHHKTTTSMHSTEEQDGNDVDEKLKLDTKGVAMRAIMLNKGEWYFIALGAFGALLNGATFPVFSLVFSEIVVVLTQTDNADDVRFWSLMFLVIAIGALLCNYLQGAMFGISGETLTRRIRAMVFASLIRQEIGFFDEKDNSVGALSTFLASDTGKVKGLAGDALGAICAFFAAIVTGLIISFVACWRLAFIVLLFVPVMGIGQALQMKLMSGFAEDAGVVFAAAGRIASEAVDNIRTVTSLGIGNYFLDRYKFELQGPAKASKKSAWVTGIAFGFSEFCMFAIWAASFSYGAKLIEDGDCDFLGVMKAISALLFSAMSLGQISALMPNVSEARVSAAKVFNIVDRKSEIDAFDTSGDKLESVSGNVAFKELQFAYPTRKDVKVLHKLSVSIDAGKTLALVGESGCGKSTLIALVERFYNLSGGKVLLDDTDMTSLNLRWLRSQIGIVSQEPDLFNTTVRENIMYGFSKDEATVVTDEQIQLAAKMANADEFIRDLPGGYDCEVGEKGGKISGGQRQRIAIARALVRNPKILLLDEATSALDSKSEKVVQEALNRAAEGRTTIVIAHRLSTIQNADKIAVVSHGKIVEEGTHQQLLSQNGAYAVLVKNQTA